MRTQLTKLNHHEALVKVNKETGEMTELPYKSNNIPEGKHKLDYKKFGMMNMEVVKKLNNFLTKEELGIIMYMTSICEMGNNSLKPFSDDLSLRELESLLDIPRARVKKVIEKLFKLGAFMSIRIYEEEEKTYWVLNPSIFWRGRLRDDSLFHTFSKTTISNLISNR